MPDAPVLPNFRIRDSGLLPCTRDGRSGAAELVVCPGAVIEAPGLPDRSDV